MAGTLEYTCSYDQPAYRVRQVLSSENHKGLGFMGVARAPRMLYLSHRRLSSPLHNNFHLRHAGFHAFKTKTKAHCLT